MLVEMGDCINMPIKLRTNEVHNLKRQIEALQGVMFLFDEVTVSSNSAFRSVAQAGGSVAGNARKDLEQRLGRPVITSQNASQLNHVVTQMIEASVATANEENAKK